MATLEYRKLDESEIREALSALQGWAVEEGLLSKDFSFDAYKSGLVFAVTVGHLADKLDHHPDLYVGYSKVRVAMNTHAVGGLSPYDFELARRIESVQI